MAEDVATISERYVERVAALARIRRDLIDRVALVDELVVMDSGSTDDTISVAREAGALVVRREDVLPEVAVRPGKGEVLWRSLATTTGDVIVFVDSDLTDFTSTFVAGLLGPLLVDATVQFVKATYDRALQSGETVLPVKIKNGETADRLVQAGFLEEWSTENPIEIA